MSTKRTVYVTWTKGGRDLELARTKDDLRRVPFAKAGCTIHKTHKPTPASSELHHVFPLYLQARVWADVDPNRPSTARNKDRVAVCGTGHSDVHLAIDALLATKRTPRGVGRTERALADLALLRFSDAKP